MESFFFGDTDQQLYGVFHAANIEAYQGRSVLLLYPVGQEYMRIHRAYRRLADRLADAGFDVLRFDYACTGDSQGNFEDASVDGWVTSALNAYDELHAMVPDSKIDLVSLRIGTIIARQLSAQRKVNKLVLWEPQISDSEFLAQLRSDIDLKGETRSNFIDAQSVLHSNGFSYSVKLQDELDFSNWNEHDRVRASRILALGTESNVGLKRFGKLLLENMSVVAVPGPDDWTVVDSMGGVFLPEPSLRAITEWLNE